MIGVINFEHGKKITAIIINENLEIKDYLEIKILNIANGNKTNFLIEFRSLDEWLCKYKGYNHYYSGPRLTGIAPKFKSGLQGTQYEPAEDSRAFLEIAKKYKRIMRYTKPKLFSNSKAALEVLFEIESSNLGLLKCCFIGFKKMKNVKYANVVDSIVIIDDYKEKKWLMDKMLPKSQKKRYGFATYKKAIFMWNNPDLKRKKLKQDLLNEFEKRFGSDQEAI